MNGSLASHIAEVLAGPIFAGRTSALWCGGSFAGPLDYAVAVPVKDEAALLPITANIVSQPSLQAEAAQAVLVLTAPSSSQIRKR